MGKGRGRLVASVGPLRIASPEREEAAKRLYNKGVESLPAAKKVPPI